MAGMSHLRSPSAHYLDPCSLERFAGQRKRRKRGRFAPPYQRPVLALFNAHCDQLVQTLGLATLHIQDPTDLFCTLSPSFGCIRVRFLGAFSREATPT